MDLSSNAQKVEMTIQEIYSNFKMVYLRVWGGYLLVSAVPQGGQRSTSDLMEPKFCVVVSCQIWVLGTDFPTQNHETSRRSNHLSSSELM